MIKMLKYPLYNELNNNFSSNILLLGTGQFLGDISNIHLNILSIKFSQNGSLIALGGSNGFVEIYALNDLLLENIKDIWEKVISFYNRDF
jgi:hypothetical protein